MLGTRFLPSKTNYIDANNPDTTHDTGTMLLGHLYDADPDKRQTWRELYYIDVSSIAGETILAAHLRVYIWQLAGTPFTCTVYRCREPGWVEEEVTYNDYRLGTPWAVAGGDPDPTTPTPVGFDACTVDDSYFEITGLAGFVTDAIANRGNIVNLLVRIDNENPGASKRNDSYTREYAANPEKRPYLYVNYSGGYPLAQSGPSLKRLAGDRTGLVGPHL